MVWEATTAVMGIAGLIWAYGSAGEERRANFRAWLAFHIARAKPHTANILFRLMFLVLLLGTAAIVFGSVKEIYEFRTSVEPLSRREVFMLILNLFNAFAYGAAFLACLRLTFGPRPKKTVPLVLKEGQPVTLFLKCEAESTALHEALQNGISVRLGIDSNRELQVETEGIDGVVLEVHRAEE
ncbi:hypothetical protein AU05_14905 [Ectopseudomonas composti]|uniref:Uncharacterized protein n=1 Tax=Ectopseudomonas composti TaxID=658457 RepID=A0ABN0SBF9_9GAMM|nr:hypothetical protein [Pseudomonas composti]EZH79870.1 hypothetical protein AU05_14905 [Pseudomonas composti]